MMIKVKSTVTEVGELELFPTSIEGRERKRLELDRCICPRLCKDTLSIFRNGKSKATEFYVLFLKMFAHWDLEAYKPK